MPKNKTPITFHDLQQVSGHGRGRTLTVPTINLTMPEDMGGMAYGVYASRVTVDGRDYTGALHYGPLPTFGETRPQLEVFLIDERDISFAPETHFTLYVVERLRDIMTFASPELLRAQILLDVERIRQTVPQVTL